MSSTTTVYAATLYHDSEYDAADKDRHLGYYPTRAAAVWAINEAKDPDNGWHTGDVQRGILHAAVFGKSPEWFEAGEPGRSTWFVGADGKAVR